MATISSPVFSIIIPSFNRGDLLPRALNSVLSQTFQDFEIIIVDDGSTDNTRIVVESMAKGESRIQYFYKRNEERSIARNFGIEMSRGTYINFLDSDDHQYKNHLETALQLLKTNNWPEVGHLGYEFVDRGGRATLRMDRFDSNSASGLIHENSFHGNAIFIRRDIASMVKFISHPAAFLSEDWCVWLRLAARYKIHFDNTITSAIVEHDGRSLTNIDPDKLITNTRLIVEFLENDDPFLRKYHGRIGYHFANHYTFLTLILALTKKRRIETIKYLLIAISYDLRVIFRRRFLASLKHLF
jgi:glycosyltransferase involved in cell wall biosynthesis